jgi:hypothetical protein
MTPRKRLVLGLTTALTTAALAAPASAAPPSRAAVTSRPTAAVQAAPTSPSMSERVQVQQELRRLDESLDRAAITQFGKRRRHYLVRNHMVDVWNGWYGPANYRHVRYTWSGTWRAKQIWDTHGSARATAAAFCGFLSRWYPAATLCLINVLAHFWMVEDAINRAISHRRCLITLTKRYGLLTSAPGFLAGTVRCVR